MSMRSRYEHMKSRAIGMRKRGAALRDVEKRLGIPKSTLNYWFKDAQLSEYHRKNLKNPHNNALVKARIKAVKWHNAQKANRLQLAAEQAAQTIANLDIKNDAVAELALAILYLGEGSKKSLVTALGNSDPTILRFFVALLQRLYNIPISKFRCYLHLRADQDPQKMTRYWSRQLGISVTNFGKPILDKRTIGRATYPHYKGVCIVECSRVAIQRKLVYIANTFCEQIAEQWAVSSVGRARD